MSIPVEYASQRKIRTRNKLHYRFNHWPIWIFVFFIARSADIRLFERGFDANDRLLGVVVLATVWPACAASCPESSAPYIIGS